ncbi:MAG: hypoxanthine phosphoribosyltransferase [Planctomycetota bacterium]
MRRDIERVLIERERIAARVRELASRLAADLAADLAAEGVSEPEGHIVMVPIMTGAMVFTSDLIRELPMKLSLELVAVTSYPGRTLESKGAAMEAELPDSFAGRHVVLIDDILDSGRTLSLVRGLLASRNPASVRTLVLLDKPTRRVVEINADYVGFTVPDAFVVGYGLDFDGYYRNLPDIATLRPEVVTGGDT